MPFSTAMPGLTVAIVAIWLGADTSPSRSVNLISPASPVTGPNAAMFALVISAIPFLARLIEINLREISAGKVEAVQMMGATRWQIIRQVLLPEALPGIIGSLTTTTIAVIGYTAMAGTVGGKGLGDLAIRNGYQSYDNVVMVATVVVLVVIVIAVQALGSALSRAVDHRAAAR